MKFIAIALVSLTILSLSLSKKIETGLVSMASTNTNTNSLSEMTAMPNHKTNRNMPHTKKKDKCKSLDKNHHKLNNHRFKVKSALNPTKSKSKKPGVVRRTIKRLIKKGKKLIKKVLGHHSKKGGAAKKRGPAKKGIAANRRGPKKGGAKKGGAKKGRAANRRGAKKGGAKKGGAKKGGRKNALKRSVLHKGRKHDRKLGKTIRFLKKQKHNHGCPDKPKPPTPTVNTGFPTGNEKPNAGSLFQMPLMPGPTASS